MNFLEQNSDIKKLVQSKSPAIITGEGKLSYSELESEMEKTASALIQSGIKKGDYVLIISPNNKDFIVLVLALWMIDAIPVPINIRLNKEEIKNLISIVGSGKIFLHKELENNFNFNEQVIFPLAKSGRKDIQINSANDINQTAVVIFTSGSTGTPKGVMLSFHNLINSFEIGDTFLQQSPSDKWLASLPFYHIGGFSIITRTLLSGASMVIPDSSDITNFKESIKRHKPTLASFVGVQLKKLLEENFTEAKNFRNILIGGGFVDDELINSAVEQGWKISKVYGSSETSSFVAAFSLNDSKNKIKSSGKAVSPNEILIVDEQKKKLPSNSIGEIAVKSVAVFTGYLNNPDETKIKLINGIYYTGDIGYIDEDGFLFVEARRSDLIVTGGENVNPLEVEKQILLHPDVEDCSVIGINDKTWGQIVVAAVVPKNKDLTELKIQEFLKNKLAGFKIPKRFLIVEQLPKTSLGKIEKEKVIALFKNN